MPDIPKYDIGLTGINAFGNSQAIQPTMYGNGFPLEQGFHLRWQLRSGLGLPARFLIYKTNEKFNRDTNTPDELDPSVWKTEAQQIALLQAEINALNEAGGQGTKYTYPTFTLHYGYWDALEWLTDALQTRGVTPSTQIAALIQKYRNSSTVLELNSLIGNLQRDIRNGQQIGNHRIYTMNQQVIEQDNRRSFRTSLKRMDTLNLAALDPYIARMAGFYFIDRDNMPFRGGSRTGYFVVADYEGQEYPFNTVIPKREAPIFNLASEMRFEGFKAIPMGGAYLCFSDAAPNNLGFLTTLSGAKPSIRIIFDEPEGIQEAIFTVKAVGASASDFWVSPNLYSTVEPTGGDIWKITVFDPNGLITPHGESRPSFKSVDIKVSNTRALIFQKVQFKYKVGQIGFIKSNPIILGGGVGEEKIQPLSLGRALAEPATPILNEQGVYEPFTANVKLSLINKAQSINPEKPNVIAANSSVRAIFELTNLNNLAVKESDITVIRGHNRVLPELLFYAPLASTAKDYATGQPLALFGKSRFVRDNPLEKKHSSLLIADNGGAYASEGVAFSVNEAFTIDLWVKIKEGNPLNEYIPWVSFGGERGVSFGFRQTTNSYTLQLKVGSETSETLPNTITPQFLNHWFRLYVSFINGRVAFNGVLIERALNVNVIPLTMGGIAIGMDFNAETQQRIRSFKGQICHVKIWNQVITIPQADYLLREYADAFPQQLIPKSLYRLKEVLSFNDTLPTYQRFIYGINTLNAGFSMQFWLYIANDESALVLCDASTSFRFGVNYMDGGCFWENSKIGFLLNFNRTPIQGQWTHISFSQDANNLFKFYIDGQLVGETLYDKYLMTRIDQPLFFGGEPTGNATLDGKIANFRLYPFPCDPIQTKRAFAVNQFLETNIPETRYKFRAKGIDLFGRISEFGPAMAYQVKSDYKPNPPATLKAQILTFETTLQSASLVTPAQPQKSYWDIQLNPILNFEIGAFLARHIITVSGLKQATTSLTDKTLIQKFVSQKYEVKAVVDNHLRLKDVPFAQLKPNEVRTYQTIPDETTPKSILIEYDSQVKLRWEWTGLQQIFNPGVTDFQIFKNIGLLNDIQVKITGVEGIPDATNRKFRVHTNRILSGDANELNGKICLIDHRAYVITAHTAAGQAASFEVRYDGYPILSPQVDTFFVLTIPETQSDWKDFSKHENWLRDEEVHNNTPSPISIDNYQITSALLTSAELEAMKADKDKIVDWLPAENTWKLRVTNIAKPPNYAENKSSEYVTSALVVYCQTDNPTQGVWNTWYVLWHEWTDSYLDLYITVADQRQNPNINNEEIDEDHPKPISSYAPLNPTKLLVEGGQMRFYQGKSFNPKVGINPPTDSDQAMLSYHFAVASKTERGLGALSVKASVVAVNRQMPLEPHAPIIESIGLADVQGNSEARIFWQNTEGGLWLQFISGYGYRHF